MRPIARHAPHTGVDSNTRHSAHTMRAVSPNTTGINNRLGTL